MPVSQPKIYNVDRYVLAADLHLPDASDRVPVVILLPGFTQTKEEAVLIALAESLTEQGIAAIRFDYAGIGASEGTVADDYRLSYMLNDVDTIWQFCFHHDRLDPARIGIWGYDLGGMMAVISAAENTRISPVCAVSAPARFGSSAIVEEQAADWESNGVWNRTMTDGRMLAVPYAFFADARKHAAAPMIPALTQPLMVMLGSEDTQVLPIDTRSYFDRATDPRELVIIDGMDHDGITDPQYQSQIIDSSVRFFHQYLV